MKFFNITEIKKYFCIMLLITSLSHHALSQNKPLIQLKDKGVSRSSSRQFIVHGNDSAARGVMCVFSERTKSGLLNVLNLPDRWNYPIVLHIRGDIRDLNTGRPIRPSIYKLPGDRYRFQIDVFLGDKFKAESLEEELVQILITELIIRSKKRRNILNKNAFIPDWIKIGLTQVLNKDGKKLNNSTISKFVRSNKMLSLDKIIKADSKSMDSITEEVYRVSCGALVSVLLSQKQGSLRLQNYLLDVNLKQKESMEKLKEVFPDGLNKTENLEEWWNAECVKIARPSATDILNPLETESMLVDCLKIKIVESQDTKVDAEKKKHLGEKIKSFFTKPNKNKDTENKDAPKKTEYEYMIYNLKDYRKFLTQDSVEIGLKITETNLLKLSYRAFPIYKPIIQEYQKIIINIGAGDLKNVDKKIEELESIRSSIVESVNDAKDYLNWFEATRIDKRSNNFSNYQQIYNELKRPLPSRKDELSEYLDDLDKEFKK